MGRLELGRVGNNVGSGGGDFGLEISLSLVFSSSLSILGSSKIAFDLSQQLEDSLEGRWIRETFSSHLEEGLDEAALDVLLSLEDLSDLVD